MAEVVILGAGLTGLSTAYHLEQYNCFDFKIFEQHDRPGGLLRSVSSDGFTFDHTGHLLHVNNDYFLRFLQTVTQLTEFNLITRQSNIFTHSTMLPYPFQMNLHGLPSTVIAECIEGYVSRTKSRKKPTTFHEWVLKHFGHGMGKHFFFPYNQKILSYDLKKVHPSWTGRFVPQTNLKAIIEGAITPQETKKVGYNSSFYYPKQGGIEFLIKKINAHVKTPVTLNHKVSHIDTQTKTVFFENGEQEKYNLLISTMPLNNLLKTTKFTSGKNYAQAEQKLLCNSVININLGLSQSNVGTGHWTYFPEREYPFYRLGYWHNICSSLVKANCSGVYGEVSYLKQKTSPRQLKELTHLTKQLMLKTLNVKSNDIMTEKILHLNHAYVIYDLWREKNLGRLLASLQTENLYSIGRYGQWKYSSMQEAVLDGKTMAEDILMLLKTKPTQIPEAPKRKQPETTRKQPSVSLNKSTI